MSLKNLLNLVATTLFIFIIIGSCKKDDPNSPLGDIINPAVTATVPANGSTGVSIRTAISASFSEAMDNQTFGPASFSIDNGVTGALSYADSMATFIPDAPLDSAILYTVTLSTALKDVAGNPIQNQYNWSFTTLSSEENQKPIAVAGNSGDAIFGVNIGLDGSSSSDPEGEPLTYRWEQIMGPDVTGGTGELTGVTPSFTAPSELSTLQFDLYVNDGVKDSDPSRITIRVFEQTNGTLFVTPTGSDANSGTRMLPLKTLEAALSRAESNNSDIIYMTNGTYNSTSPIALVNGVSIYGGFTESDWFYSETPGTEIIVNSTTATAITATFINRETVISYLTIKSADNTTPSGSSYGIKVKDSDGLIITDCVINSGKGGNGTNGAENFIPAAGGGNGSLGQSGCEDSGIGCAACARPMGGAGGSSPAGMLGGKGGSAGHGTSIGSIGTEGVGGASGGSGTPAGLGDFNPASTYCGTNGTAGVSGTNGAGGVDGYGIDGYLPTSGVNGTSGSPGKGGGGGGGGGGGTTYCDSYGGAGGGGGGGGAGGSGGKGGTSAGASFALYLYNSDIIIRDCRLIVDGGGNGGNGSAGQIGGNGGIGGSVAGTNKGNVYGGADDQDDGSNGGKGGNGGNGGRGGAGGGGAGGSSIGIFKGGGSNPVIDLVSFDIAPGGIAGTSPGNAGRSGRSENVYTY